MQAEARRACDMPNQLANPQTVVDVDMLVHDISVQPGSDHNVISRALVVHDQPDVCKSQPAGNADPRIPCGAITSDAAKPQG